MPQYTELNNGNRDDKDYTVATAPAHPLPTFLPPLFPSDPFYRTIIDNNPFRPLGWTPPRPSESYRLLGTIRFPRDVNIPPKAILQTTPGNTTYIVALGEMLDADTEVVNICQKQITLETNGQQRTVTSLFQCS